MQVTITGFHAEENLGILQLATSGQDTFEYVSCGKALADKLIQVKEVDAAGSVNTILALNLSDSFVFLMDGDILAGAKQNRVVNASMLLAPRSKTPTPVSCVEQGRWSRTSAGFHGTDYVAPTFLRSGKADQVRQNLKNKQGFASDQGQIWNSVEYYQRDQNVQSETSNLSDIFEDKADKFTRLVARFAPDEHANGFAVFFGKTLTSIDIFNRRQVYHEYFPRLLRGAALEAATLNPGNVPLEEPEARYRALELLDAVELEHCDEQESSGVGVDRRFDAPEFTGFQLVYPPHLIHLAVFKRAGARAA